MRRDQLAARLAARLNADGAWEMSAGDAVFACVQRIGLWFVISDGGGGWPEATSYATEEAARVAMLAECHNVQQVLDDAEATEDEEGTNRNAQDR